MHKSEDCLCWPLRLTEGLLLHVPWGTLGAAEPWLLTLLSCSEGLTVPLAPYLGGGSFIAADSYGSLSWQLADENPKPSCHYQCCHHQPSAPTHYFTGRTWNPRNHLFFVVLTVGQCDGKLKYQYFLLQKRETRFHYKCGAGWVTGWSLEARKAI